MKAYAVFENQEGAVWLNESHFLSLTTGGASPDRAIPVSCSSEPIVLESNQNHAATTQDGVSTTLTASMGMGGGYVPMIVETLGANVYAGVITGDVAPTVTTATGVSNATGPKLIEVIYDEANTLRNQRISQQCHDVE